jgi:hypothetical protein
MRFILLSLAGGSLMLPTAWAGDAPRQADPDEKFYEMFTEGAYKDGRLNVIDWEFCMTWINGVRQSEVDTEYQLKPGDVVERFDGAHDERVLRYRLDRLSPERADFTRWIYSAIKSRNAGGLWEHRRGALQLTDSFSSDLTQPNGLLIDYPPNRLISSGQKTARSK